MYHFTFPATAIDGRHVPKVLLRDICYIDLYKPNWLKKHTRIRFVTYQGERLWKFNGSFEAAVEQFEQFGFTLLDTGNLVNIQNVVCIDKKNKRAYFDKILCTSVSDGNMYKVEHLPEKE